MVRLRIRDTLHGKTIAEGTPREMSDYWKRHNRPGYDDWRPQIYDERRARTIGREFAWRDLYGREIQKWRNLFR